MGVKVDTTLVLIGKQGARKSTAWLPWRAVIGSRIVPWTYGTPRMPWPNSGGSGCMNSLSSTA